MVCPSRDLPNDMQQVAHTSGRDICNKVQLQVTAVCLIISRLPSLGSVCTLSALGGSGPLCLPNNSLTGPSGGETKVLPVHENHPDCSKMAEHALLLGSGGCVRADQP